MDYILMTENCQPPFERFDDLDNAVKEAQEMALSQGRDITIWHAVRKVHLQPEVEDLTIPVVPEPPRRGRPRKAEKALEYPDADGCLKPPESPCPLPLPKALPDPPYRLDILKPPLLIDSYGCKKDPDGVYRACILYTRDGVTGSAIGKHEINESLAATAALVDMGIVYLPDLEALPDTEGKRQVLAAVGDHE